MRNNYIAIFHSYFFGENGKYFHITYLSFIIRVENENNGRQKLVSSSISFRSGQMSLCNVTVALEKRAVSVTMDVPQPVSSHREECANIRRFMPTDKSC